MNMIDRRTVLGAGVAGTLGAIMPARMLAQPVLIVRPSLQSPIGKEMVKVYAKAVALMMDKNKYLEGDPRSWTFQWYTHMVRGDRDKASEMSRIFPKGGGGRNVAEAMWDTCEAHKDFSREQFFLPWHRLYVLCFEQIVRHVSGQPDFALPYWDYTDQTQRALPIEFRSPNDPILKSLYRKNRLGPINNGAAIDSLPGAGPIDLDALKSLDYMENVADAGFCANLDGNLHGNVHGNVGNQMGMGSVNWAADDPVFWLHHCNIDRIWASWNREGGKNPSELDYLNEAFTFADSTGSALSLKVSDAMQMNGYGYDAYVGRPLGFPNLEQGGPTFVSRHGVSKVVTPTVELSSTKRQIRLARPVTSPDGGPLLTSISPPSAASRSARFYLKLENISTNVDPETTFDVYVSRRPDVVTKRGNASYVGTVSFFGTIQGHHNHGGTAPGKIVGRTVSFLLSEAQREEVRGGELPYVTLVPSGRLAINARPVIGNIAFSSR